MFREAREGSDGGAHTGVDGRPVGHPSGRKTRCQDGPEPELFEVDGPNPFAQVRNSRIAALQKKKVPGVCIYVPPVEEPQEQVFVVLRFHRYWSADIWVS